jgi:hypothetical protein
MSSSSAPIFIFEMLNGTVPIIADNSIIKLRTNVRNIIALFLGVHGHYDFSRECSFSMNTGRIADSDNNTI